MKIKTFLHVVFFIGLLQSHGQTTEATTSSTQTDPEITSPWKPFQKLVAKKLQKTGIPKNTKSNHIHHVGAAEQQLLVHAEAKNRNGVAIQCTIHKALAAAPIISDLCLIT